MGLVKLNDRGVRSATTFGSLNTGSMTFIKKLTASSSDTLSFVDGASDVVLDDTYKEYLFTFKDIHPANDGVALTFNMSIDAGSNYNVTKTTTLFRSIHKEDDSDYNFSYRTGEDLAQGTGFQHLHTNSGNDNDLCIAGQLTIFNPSDTTFIKHFISRMQSAAEADWSQEFYAAGYGNTTSAVDAIQFKMASGNIDAGDICLYGIK